MYIKHVLTEIVNSLIVCNIFIALIFEYYGCGFKKKVLTAI